MKKLQARQLALLSATICAAGLLANTASASQIYITEWLYSGNAATAVAGEFIEFTNLSAAAIDMTGWSFDDDSATPGSVSLSAFGVVNPGESVILAEANAATFISAWGLSGVDVIGLNSNNLARNDVINLYDDSGSLIDSLAYGDQNFPGTIRTQNVSGNPGSLAVLENPPQDSTGWVLSVNGDVYGSYVSAGGDIGNPGISPFAAPVPLPAAAWLMLSGLAGLFGIGRRRASAAQSAGGI